MAYGPPLPPRLAYRIVDSNTNAEVISNLPHPHQSDWTVRALQQGYPGSTTIGDFRIPLPGPPSAEFQKFRQYYDQLAVGQKVEGSLGDVITKLPRVSGVITKLHKPLDGPWLIEGSDTLWWLQQTQTLPGEQLASTLNASGMVGNFLQTYEVDLDDDFTGGLGSYTNSNWSLATDPDLGLQSITATVTTPTEATISNVNTWPASDFFNGSTFTAWGTLHAGTAFPPDNDTGEVALFILADSTLQNGMWARMRMIQTANGSGLWNVFAEIVTRSAGVDTSRISTQVFSNVGQVFRFEVKLVCTTAPGSISQMRLIVNGKDTNCVYQQVGTAASGRVGLRWSPAVGGTPQVYINRIAFHVKTRFADNPISRFQLNAGAAGPTLGQNVLLNGQTHLDMLLMASAFSGWWVRKNPGAGFKADNLDFAANPGADLSNAIKFVEGVNVLPNDTAVMSVADLFSHEVKVQAIPGADSGGSITWTRMGNIGDQVLVDAVYDLGVPTFQLLMGYARQVQARKVNPMQATQLRVARNPDVADLWRELDSIEVHVPTLSINHLKQQIVGYTLDEREASQIVWLNQFPERVLPQAQLQKFVRSLDYLTGLFQPR